MLLLLWRVLGCSTIGVTFVLGEGAAGRFVLGDRGALDGVWAISVTLRVG